MSGITTCLWFNGKAEEAASYYVSLFPNSHVDAVNRSPDFCAIRWPDCRPT